MATSPAPWTLSYGDGSANVYRLSQAGGVVHFEYVPVRPEESSTGHYSGGEPKQADLPADDPRVTELWRRVQALEADASLHTSERAKRTGQFSLTGPEGTRSFIVQFCPALAELDEFLLSFRR